MTKVQKNYKPLAGLRVLNPGMLAIVAGVLILLGGLWVLLSRASTTITTTGTITRRFPGDPNPKQSGKAYWGASYGGNSDPKAQYETPTGKSLSVRRTFWSWDNNRTSMISTVKADLSANRLPFVSTKTPKWAEVAAGQHDPALDDMLTKLNATGGPVWLTLYHEPEDNTDTNTGREKCEKTVPESCEGTSADWRAMQTRVRSRMKALGTKNIAFMPVLMAWTFDPPSKRNPAEYWVDGIWDAYISDAYCDFNCDAAGKTPITNTQWLKFAEFAEAKAMPYGTAEWGNRGSDSIAAQEMKDYWEWGFKNNKDIIVQSYFDSGLNSDTGSWSLQGEPLTTFKNILKNDVRVQRIADLNSATATVSPSPTPTPTTTTTTVTPTPTPTTTVTPTSTPTTTVTSTSTPTPTPTTTTTVTPPTPTADSTKPSIPGNIKASISFDALRFSYYTGLSWSASYDNVGVSRYLIKRNGTQIGTSTTSTTKFQDYNIVPNTYYTYDIYAQDAAGNTSQAGSARLVGRCFLIWCWAE